MNEKGESSSLRNDEPLFSFYLVAKRNLKELTNIFNLDNEILEKEFIQKSGKKRNVQLHIHLENIGEFNRKLTNHFTKQATLTNLDLICYPNPARNHLNVAFSMKKSDIVTLVLKDITGRELKSLKLNAVKGQNIKTVDLLTFSAKGLIFISIESSEGIKTTSFLKE